MGLFRDNATNNRKEYNGLKSQLVGGINLDILQAWPKI